MPAFLLDLLNAMKARSVEEYILAEGSLAYEVIFTGQWVKWADPYLFFMDRI